MNTEMEVVIAGLIGFVIGAVLMAIIGRGNKGKKDEETAKLQAEYDSYREKVNAHFAKTADAVDGLTKSYQQVFDHLSDGAQNLMDKKALQDQLEKRQGKAVTLAYLVDQEEASQTSTSKVENASVVSDGKQSIDPLAKKDAPVPADEKADVVAHANTVKTAVDKPKAADTTADKLATKADSDKSGNAKPESTKPESVKAAELDKAKLDQSSKSSNAASSASNGKDALNKDALNKVPADDESKAKSNVHKAAESAGLKPAESITQSNHHESAIDSVKKHIKDDGKDKGSKV